MPDLQKVMAKSHRKHSQDSGTGKEDKLEPKATTYKQRSSCELKNVGRVLVLRRERPGKKVRSVMVTVRKSS